MDDDLLLDAQIDAANVERLGFVAESARLRLVAHELVQQAQRLQTEATRLETQALQLRAKAAARSNWMYSLKCEKILECLRRNDPETTQVLINEYDAPLVGQAKLLGQALEGNTVVSELSLEVQMLLPRRIDAVPISLVQQLLQFLATSPSLRRVHLVNSKWSCDLLSDAVAHDLTGMLVNAIVQNAAIVMLNFHLTDHAWLQTISSQMRLTALQVRFFGVEDRDIPAVATCIASQSQHLQELDLTVRGEESLCVAILTQLCSAESSLRHLRLKVDSTAGPPVFTALAQFLCSTTRLDHLELSGLYFYETELEIVLRGLRHVNVDTGVTTIYVSKLHFTNVEFFKKEFAPMAAFLKTRIHRHGAVTCRSALQELCFHPCEYAEMGLYGACQLANSLLMARLKVKGSGTGTTLVPTIGSLVRSISLGGVPRIFLDHLGRHAHRVRLEALELIDVPKDTGMALGACLPKLNSLKVLKLAMVETGSPYWILRGLMRNGTLLSVEITNDEECCNFDAAQLRFVEAYCERNSVLGELLDNEAELARPILPSLLQVAKQAPVMQVSNLVRGLLSLEDLNQCSVAIGMRLVLSADL
jgi:hypothetical protein